MSISTTYLNGKFCLAGRHDPWVVIAAPLEAKKEGFSHDRASLLEETRNFGYLWKVTTTNPLECGNTEEESSTAVFPLPDIMYLSLVGFIRWVLYPILREASFQTNQPLPIWLIPRATVTIPSEDFSTSQVLKNWVFLYSLSLVHLRKQKPPKLWRSSWVDAGGCSSTQ